MASQPQSDPYIELEARAKRLGMEPRDFLTLLLDEEKRPVLLKLEAGERSFERGDGSSWAEVRARLEEVIAKNTVPGS